MPLNKETNRSINNGILIPNYFQSLISWFSVHFYIKSLATNLHSSDTFAQFWIIIQ